MNELFDQPAREIITHTSEEFFEAVRQIEADGGRVCVAERLGRTGHTGWRLRFNRAEDRQPTAPACPPRAEQPPGNVPTPDDDQDAPQLNQLPKTSALCSCCICREARRMEARR